MTPSTSSLINLQQPREVRVLHRSFRLLALLALWAGTAHAEDPYRLGPLDQLQVKVSDLRAGTGEAYQWTAFTGDFTVGPSGSVSLPVVGEIDVNGKTTSDLEAAIASKLQTKAGLATKPDASVQIIKFRPFYIMGVVEKPGEYDYRPGLTVLQAVSIAGGLERVSNDALLSLARDAITARGDVRVYDIDRLALLARQARLDAEIAEKPTIDWPADLQARSREVEIARILREEQQLFDSRRSGLAAQIVTIQQSKAFLNSSIVALTTKDATSARQQDLMKKELDTITTLVARGMTVLPRQLELEQTTAQIESNRLDTQVAIIRAREDITKADRDITDLKTSRRNEALQEASEVRTKLAQTLQRIETARSLVEQNETRAPATVMAEVEGIQKPDYAIARRSNGRVDTVPVNENDMMQPGDVLRVTSRSRADIALSRGASTPSGAF